MHDSTAQPNPAAVGQVVFSRTARSVIVAACRRGKPQAVLLSWPAGATYLPAEYYQPGTFDVVVGHIAGCPIYVDVRRRALFRGQHVLLDAECVSRTRPHPALLARAIPSSPQPAGQDRSGGHNRFDVLATQVADELVDELAGVYAPHAIRAAARRAISDLRGSVTVEALPEMAARLVRHRLAATRRRLRNGQPTSAMT